MTALSVYEWMKAPAAAGGAALSPTVYTYTAAMRAALAAGLLDRALAVWEDAQAAECPLDCRLCITYIEVSASGGAAVRHRGAAVAGSAACSYALCCCSSLCMLLGAWPGGSCGAARCQPASTAQHCLLKHCM